MSKMPSVKARRWIGLCRIRFLPSYNRSASGPRPLIPTRQGYLLISCSSKKVKRSSHNHLSVNGKPDYASLAYGQYGGNAGIWRIMDALNRNGVKGTIDTNGRIAEDFPDALKELHAGGHEIVGHGWVNDTALSS